MFLELSKMLHGGEALSMNLVKGEGDALTLTVVPVGHKDSALSQPLSLKGTAQELDEGIVAALQSYVGAHTSLRDQVAATVDVLAAAAQEEKAKAATAIKKSTTPMSKVAGSRSTAIAPGTAATPKSEPGVADAGAAADSIDLF